MKNILLLILIIATFVSCSSLKKVIEPPKIKLETLRIKNLAFSEMDLEVVLEVSNPNNIDFDVKNLKYSIEIDSKTITTAALKEKIEVKPKDKTIVALPLTVKYSDILSSALMFFKKEGMPYKIQGSAEIGPFTIPFSDKGNLKPSDKEK